MTVSIPVKNKLTAIHEGNLSSLYKLIRHKIDKTVPINPNHTDSCAQLWTADWWGLTDCIVFREQSVETQITMMSSINQSLLTEAYFIEKSGLAYTAKMVLLAETTDIAQWYAFMGADEAKHLAWIEPYVDHADKVKPNNPFLDLLSDLIESGSVPVLTYLIQIILEGWGLDHYGKLYQGCRNAPLKTAFRQILKDEALHHRSGHILYDRRHFTKTDFLFLQDTLRYYAEMVRVGPQIALAELDKATQGLSKHHMADFLVALDHEAESARKLALLKKLMMKPGLESILSGIGDHYFQPLSTEAAILFYLKNR